MKKKSITITIILITIINTFIPLVNASQLITKANLINSHKIDSHIMYYNEDREEWRNIQCGFICYKIDGEKYPAYCITHGMNGVDEEGAYTVTIHNLLDNKLIYNTIINGYPYKTPAQLGVANADDAYVATKHAVNSVLLNRDVKTFYKAADERGEKIINAIYDISEKGKNGIKENGAVTISINKIGKLTEKGEYYYQEYNVNADVDISNYTVVSIEDFPEGSYVSSKEFMNRNEFSADENFIIMIPKEQLYNDINGKININALCNTKPIFYGEAPKSGIQDYAITYKPYVEFESSKIVNEVTNTSSIQIIKQDEESAKPISNVLFGLYTEKEEYITEVKTNEYGIALFSNLYQGKYKIKELDANENYEKDDTMYEINTSYDKQESKVITNTHKKGNLKITKVDKDNKKLKLAGIEFDVIDCDKQIIAHLVTDENGQAQINNINIGKYTIKETKTKENYNLCIDNNIEVKWNMTSEIVIENEKKKGQIKITKQDKENKKIKLEGIEFEIINEEGNIVDNIITDDNGEAVTKRLPVGEYIIKEVCVGKNTEYILEETEYKIKIEDEVISEIVIENLHKKGNLKITKVDKDDKTITLGAIEFDLIDKDGKVVSHLITDVNGEAYIENINTGVYILKETITKREYNLCENKDIIVEWNKVSDITIENEKKKGQIKIIKQDAEKEEIKLEGVRFQVIDINGNVVEEIVTNSQGEAISSRLLIGEYKLKEIDLGNNTDYLLNNEDYIVNIKNEEISEILIKNQHKKGNVKIKKIDKDDQSIVLEGVVFEITDEEGFLYKAITDENGIAVVNNVRIGNISIKEVKTDERYVLTNNVYNLVVGYNKTEEFIIKNEKKKGQVEIYKIDKENNEINIPGVEFEILDKNNQVIDTVKTNENGYAISEKLPIGEYYVKEIKTDNKYVLNTEVTKVSIEENKIISLTIQNEKKKGKIKIIKTSSNDSPILNIKSGEFLSDVVFEIFNINNELVDTIITNEEGEAISKKLEIGRYIIKEKNTSQYYILSDKHFVMEIKENNEIKILEIQNEAVVPRVNIEKIGQQYAEKNEEIRFEFDIKNVSNAKLDNFTWTEYIPYEKSKITKMVTGIYNEDINYEIYYKTNQNDYKLLKRSNSSKSEYINFEDLKLDRKETITEIKVEYKTVSKDFYAIIKPMIYTKIDNNVKKEDIIVNITKLSGNVEEYMVEDKSSFETIIKEKEIIKKLPKTGC